MILAFELKPPRVTRLPLRSGDDATDAGHDPPRPGRDAARGRHIGVDGISSAAVTVRRRRARITATAAARNRAAADTLTEPVTQALQQPPGQPEAAPPAAPEGARRHPEPLMHADRTNRVALTLFGLLLLLAGAAGITASAGVFGAAFSHRTLLANPASTYIGHHGGWLWPAAAAACLLLALACLRWILALLLSTDRARDITVPGGTARAPRPCSPPP